MVTCASTIGGKESPMGSLTPVQHLTGTFVGEIVGKVVHLEG